MIKNLNASIKLLEQALQTLPDDKDLIDAKGRISTAISSIELANKKRGNKKTEAISNAQKWQFDLKLGLINTSLQSSKNAQKTLDAIEAMIMAEQTKLDDLKRPETPTQMFKD
jgi:cob(I)alamin adenosyltransferase